MRVLYTADDIAARVQTLGTQIREHYGDEAITVVCVLKGSFLFFADLVRAIGGDVRIQFLGMSSYKGTQSTGEVRITHDLRTPIEGKHVLLVEDIVDTGLTMDCMLRTLNTRNPRSLELVTLLDKPSRRSAPVQARWAGFVIPNAFVVGYGLDLDERFRALPYVAIYEPEIDGPV